MSITKNIRPLLTENYQNDGKNIKKKQNKRRNILIVIICLFIFATIGVLIATYLEGMWWFTSSNIPSKAGIYGKFPVWGGNIKNQQISLDSLITKHNVNDIEQLCVYTGSVTDISLNGYITIDSDYNGYFGDTSGYINSINLNSCKINWSVFINDILNYTGNGINIIPNTATLYQSDNGEKGVMFGTENTLNRHCYVISLDINDGSLIWINKLGTDYTSSHCKIHGFMIDKQFAFGGMSSNANLQPPPFINNRFIGKMSKININNGQLINQWYTIPIYNDSVNNYEIDGFYSGAAIWPISAIIDDYIVFGTGNLYTYTRAVQQCLLGNTTSIPIENVFEYDLCPTDMRDKYLNWRCLEKNIYTDSLIVLDKNSFDLKVAIPFAGVDGWHFFCDWLINETVADSIPDCPKVVGADADAVSIATYHDLDGIPHALIGQKSGQFYIVEIPTGNVKIIKKVGPNSFGGGSAPFSMAVDEKHMIAVFSLSGGAPFPPDFVYNMRYKYKMGDGTIVCSTSSIHVIDLNTGYTLWQWINPYGKLNNLCNDTIYDEYFDLTINGTCEYSINGTDMLSPNQTVNGNVVIPPIDDDEDEIYVPLYAKERAFVIGPVAINNDMIFISSLTGDIFIHNILNGEYIGRIQCPNYKYNDTHWNRAGIRSGITMFEDRIIFYCGSDQIQATFGNQIISMNLPT